MSNKIAMQARLMSKRASIDSDVAKALIDASNEIERLEGYGKKKDFLYSSKELADSKMILCARCNQPLNDNGHCKSIACLGKPVRTMPTLNYSVPVEMVLRAIDENTDFETIEAYARNTFAFVIALGETDDEFKERVKNAIILSSNKYDFLCSHCHRPLNSDGQCHHILCTGGEL